MPYLKRNKRNRNIQHLNLLTKTGITLCLWLNCSHDCFAWAFLVLQNLLYCFKWFRITLLYFAQIIIFALHTNFIVDFINLGLAKFLWPQAAVCVSAHFIQACHSTLGFTSFGGPTSIRLVISVKIASIKKIVPTKMMKMKTNWNSVMKTKLLTGEDCLEASEI